MEQALISRRQALAGMAGLAAGLLSSRLGAAAAKRPPNIVIVFTDDQGYQDLGCFGSPDIKTPNIDRMAAEGRRFTDFYVPQAVCSASRAGLMTGCYPNRIGIQGALGPKSKIGISDGEMTLAELVKPLGYATAMFGKWHLGDSPGFLPVRHGFDEYFGLPYSNDMWPKHPTNPKAYPPLPLIEQDKVVQIDPDQTQLTTWYTQRAVRFIERNREKPFLLYVAHNMPHVPLFVSDKHRGRSARGLYGDVIEEIDWSVGQIIGALKAQGLEENTLVVFTSDNGPWLSYGEHSGSALPLREGKGTSWEGGVRESCVMRWPGRIPAGTACSEPAMTIDLLPTVAALTGAKLPQHRIDGLDITPLIFGQPNAASPHEALWFYWGLGLEAIRSGRWKLHFPHPYRSMAGRPGGTGGRPNEYRQAKTGLALYDLQADVGETRNLVEQEPEAVKRLQALAEKARAELGDSLTGRKGAGVRQAGRIGGNG